MQWGRTFEIITCPLQTRWYTKARSVCSCAKQLNSTNNLGPGSIFFWFVHVHGSTNTFTSPSVKNQGIGRISDKPKISGSGKKKHAHSLLLWIRVLPHQYHRCHHVWACCVSCMALFSDPRRLGCTSLLSTYYLVVVEEDTWRAVARHCLEIWLLVLVDKSRAGPQLLP